MKSSLIFFRVFGVTLLTLSFNLTSHADPDDIFPFESAPIVKNIEGTWISSSPFPKEGVVFQFCRISGRVRLVKRTSLSYQSEVVYRSVNFGRKASELRFSIRDPQFPQAGYFSVNSYFLREARREVGLLVRAVPWGLNGRGKVQEFKMRRVSSSKPRACM